MCAQSFGNCCPFESWDRDTFFRIRAKNRGSQRRSMTTISISHESKKGVDRKIGICKVSSEYFCSIFPTKGINQTYMLTMFLSRSKPIPFLHMPFRRPGMPIIFENRLFPGVRRYCTFQKCSYVYTELCNSFVIREDQIRKGKYLLPKDKEVWRAKPKLIPQSPHYYSMLMNPRRIQMNRLIIIVTDEEEMTKKREQRWKGRFRNPNLIWEVRIIRSTSSS